MGGDYDRGLVDRGGGRRAHAVAGPGWPAHHDGGAIRPSLVGDSPQFSTLNAHNAPKALVGSALTIANCIGFAITIVSIQLLNALSAAVDAAYLYLPLALGPAFGLAAMMPLMRRTLRRT